MKHSCKIAFKKSPLPIQTPNKYLSILLSDAMLLSNVPDKGWIMGKKNSYNNNYYYCLSDLKH